MGVSYREYLIGNYLKERVFSNCYENTKMSIEAVVRGANHGYKK